MKGSRLITARRFVVLIAAVLCGSLVFASPARALCTVTASWDDGSKDTTMDLDYVDDLATKQFYVPTTALANTGITVGMAATAYGGCGSYIMLVNGAADHTFDTCSPGWQSQRLTTVLTSGIVAISVEDIDGTWTTGIYFDVDANRGGESTMTENGTDVSSRGELMWRMYVDALIC